MKNIEIDVIRSAAAAALPEIAPVIAKVGSTPEIGFEEKTAAACQVEYLKKAGFSVQEKAG